MQLIPAAILWGLLVILPFSPRWLVDKGRDKEAITAISKIRGQPPDSREVQAEYQEIKNGAEIERKVGSISWSELLKPGIRNRVAIGVILQCFQQWTGINIILYYAAKLFQGMGFDMMQSSVIFVIVNAAINFFATIPGMYLVEKIGRKMLMVIGGFAMGISHFLICV